MSKTNLTTRTHCGPAVPLHIDAARAMKGAARKHAPRVVFGPAAFAVVAAGMTLPANAAEAVTQDVAPAAVQQVSVEQAPVAAKGTDSNKSEGAVKQSSSSSSKSTTSSSTKKDTSSSSKSTTSSTKKTTTPSSSKSTTSSTKKSTTSSSKKTTQTASKEASAKGTVKKVVTPSKSSSTASTKSNDGKYAERGSERGGVSLRDTSEKATTAVNPAAVPVINENGVLVTNFDKDTSYDVEFRYNEDTLVDKLASAITDPAKTAAATPVVSASAGATGVVSVSPKGQETVAKKVNDVLPQRTPGVDGTVSTTNRGQAVVDIARQSVGVKYAWGKSDLRTGVDCSGLTSAVYAKVGVKLPRTSSQQKNAGVRVSLAEAKPGDLIWSPGHIAIYIGNGKIIDASGSKQKVVERNMWQTSGEYQVIRVLPENNA